MISSNQPINSWLSTPWQPGFSFYTHKLTRANCIRVMESNSTEGSLPKNLQIAQVKRILESLDPSVNSAWMLDLACGLGEHLILATQQRTQVPLASNQKKTISAFGVDINPLAYKRAKQRARAQGLALELLSGDLSDPALLRELDHTIPHESLGAAWMVYGTWCTLDPNTRQTISSLVYKKLAPGGVFLFDGFYYPGMSGSMKPEPSLLREEEYWSGWGGFWGLIPRKVREQSWIFDQHQLFVDLYWVGFDTPFASWRQSVNPELEIKQLNAKLSRDLGADSSWEPTYFPGSFGIGLSPEVSKEPPDPIRKAWILPEEDSTRGWNQEDPWFTVKLVKPRVI
jgi:SAM-dependent methyltransferase